MMTNETSPGALSQQFVSYQRDAEAFIGSHPADKQLEPTKAQDAVRMFINQTKLDDLRSTFGRNHLLVAAINSQHAYKGTSDGSSVTSLLETLPDGSSRQIIWFIGQNTPSNLMGSINVIDQHTGANITGFITKDNQILCQADGVTSRFELPKQRF